jgi:hypothetical protein
MTRTFHTLYVIVLAGLILTGIAQGRGMMRHGGIAPDCQVSVSTPPDDGEARKRLDAVIDEALAVFHEGEARKRLDAAKR